MIKKNIHFWNTSSQGETLSLTRLMLGTLLMPGWISGGWGYAKNAERKLSGSVVQVSDQLWGSNCCMWIEMLLHV